MPRTLDDIRMQIVFPPAGKYTVKVVAVEKGVSSKKKTPQISVVFSNGENDFDDNFYVTEKTLSRLCLFARRVCLMPKETVLPDDDMEASIFVAKYIMGNALGKMCVVTIEENEESFICESGPDIGTTKTVKKRKVAFKGYDAYVQPEPGQDKVEPATYNIVQDENLPF